MRIYDYIFLKINLFLRNFFDSSDFSAIIVMCWLLFFNGITIIEFTINIAELSDYISKYTMIGYAVFILIFHFAMYNNKRQLHIKEKFDKESKSIAIIGNILVFIYVLMTVFVYFKYTVPRIGGVLK